MASRCTKRRAIAELSLLSLAFRIITQTTETLKATQVASPQDIQQLGNLLTPDSPVGGWFGLAWSVERQVIS